MKRNRSRIISGLSVEVEGNFEKSLRLFNKKVQDSGLLKEVKNRMYYEPKSSVKKSKKKAAIKRWHKKLDKMAPKKSS